MSKINNEETPSSQSPERFRATLKLLLISIVTLVLQATIVVVLLVFRQFLWLFLKLKYGERFGGLMSPGDSVWMTDDDSRHISNTIILFDSKMTADEFNNFFLKSLLENPWRHNHPLTNLKMTCTYDFCMGYAFYLKDNIKISDCFVTLNVGDESKEFLEKSDLTDILSECGTRPLAMGNKALWETVTLNKPLRTEDSQNGVYTYIVIYRCHHSMGDGMSIVNYLLRNLADDQEVIHENLEKLVKTMDKRDEILGKPGTLTTIKNILKLVKCVLMSPSVIRKEKLRLMDNVNSLHGPRLSGDKYIVYSIERSDERLLDAMRKMKNGVPGATFNVVALTAISRAMQRYFDMNCKNTPRSVIATTPLPMAIPEIKKKIKTKNSLSAALLSLPMLRSQATVRDQMAAVVGEMRAVKSKPDVVVKYLMINGFLGYLPTNIMTHFMTTSGVATFSFSNIPGVPVTKCCQHVMRDMFFITPNLTKCGLGFSMMTYRGILKVGLIVDRSLIPSKQAAQDLTDSVLEEIRLMYEEFKRSSI